MLKNSNWKNKVKPNLSQGEKNIRSFVKVFALMVFFFLLAVLIASIYNKQPPLTILCIVCLIMIFFSWLKLSPGLYNRIHRRKKLVPLGEKTDRKKILEDIYLSQTPYGLPFNFQVGNVIFPTPIYIMRDIGWIVYFCIQNQDIVIRARTIHGMSLYARRVKNRKILGQFENDVTRLFNFIINSKRQPSLNELNYIFEKSLRFRQSNNLNSQGGQE